MQKPYEAVVNHLMKVPCIKEISARLLLAELTDDLGSFSTSELFCSWLGICPGNNKSTGKSYESSTPKGNKWVRIVLTEIAHSIGLSKNNHFKERFQVFKEKKVSRRAIVAIAHKNARLCCCMIRTGEVFHGIGGNVLRDYRLRKITRDLGQGKKDSHMDISSDGIIDTSTGEVLIPARASCRTG